CVIADHKRNNDDRTRTNGMALQRRNAVVVHDRRGSAGGRFCPAFWAAHDGFVVGAILPGRCPLVSIAVPRRKHLFRPVVAGPVPEHAVDWGWLPGIIGGAA